ncbi:hypothetical protein PI124_g21048 [Phytophthora idaei]|nr:hypothetical protein PI125_g22400 [Phytophthora idaei]KAG3130228.1 hypothetical protein PI126_g20602 [Phytophthora idaei]KAG3233890.1 hypothetical protein PI124_g21048 [Phytophthora idaei]
MTKKKTGKEPTQQYMHQYLQGKPGLKERTSIGERKPTNTDQHGTESRTVDQHEGSINTRRRNGFGMLGYTTGTDRGSPLYEWLNFIGGKITDVPATGQCGWMAFHAALHNIEDGFNPLTQEVADAANELKRQIINGMIANLEDEGRLHPSDLESDLKAVGRMEER